MQRKQERVRQIKSKGARATVLLSLTALSQLLVMPARALDNIGDMAQEQAQEKLELEDMRNEMKDIKGQVRDAMGAMSALTNQGQALPNSGPQQMNVREIHLFAREANLEVGAESGANKATIKALTYNGKIPGPEIHVRQGEAVRIVLHNNLKNPALSTSLHFHGLIAPHKVDGLPRAGGATTAPERFLKADDSFIYQFIANQTGTFFYHPQIIHQDQRFKGMFGAIIVHPRLPTKEADKELVLFLSSAEAIPKEAKPESGTTAKHLYLVNGKTAPFIPALEVLNGERVRLHIINTLDQAVPLHLSGHRFEVTGINGSDPLEPRVIRDTITINPSDRIDLEFTANNPGVWSLASELPGQNSNNGKFPGGIAMIVRYSELTPPPAQ
ncbi:MAG: multicopper oxidase family protein [Candidatus Melainabacteria bacterium]|nr:multicopper oxidase family protein [Candidatus Melainabacteria bacterium]